MSCAAALQAAGLPPEARRPEPPPKIETRVPSAGDAAPTLELASTEGRVDLKERLRSGPAVVVYFRGTW